MWLQLIAAGDIDPAKFLAGLATFGFAVAGFDLGIAFLMRGVDEAAGDARD